MKRNLSRSALTAEVNQGRMTAVTFHLPVWFDLGATLAFGLTGALAAIRRGYDIVGIFFLTLVSGIGGGLLRDGIFIRGEGPTPLLTDERYIEVVAAATVLGTLCGSQLRGVQKLIATIDALGLGAHSARKNPCRPAFRFRPRFS